jgi:hypothetical protein
VASQERHLLPRDARVTLVGMSGAEYLMDRPAGGWSDLVTTQTLELRFVAFEAKMDLRFAEVDRRFDAVDHRFDRFEHELLAQVDRRLRSQAWMMISTIVAVGGVIVAAIRL